MELQVHNAEGKVVEAIQFDESCLGAKVRKRLLKQAVVAYASHLMSGTRSTKKRGAVSGGGKKPYKQKHTGRSRMGSIRSPLLRGGGIIFGPQSNENPRKEMTRSMRREALKSALLAKFLDKEVKVIDELKFDGPKTARMAGILKALGMNGHSCLIALAGRNDAAWKSARNIPRLSVFQVGSLNAYVILKRSMMLFTKEAVVKLPEVLKR